MKDAFRLTLVEPQAGDCRACVNEVEPLCLACRHEPDEEPVQDVLDLGIYSADTRNQLGLELGIWGES